ncbi:MAG: HEAT repeat domain-containing protein [Bryobacteraceae bacterium]
MIRHYVLLFALTGVLSAQERLDWPSSFTENFQARSEGFKDAAYQEGMQALDAHRWDQAVQSFEVAASHKGSAADAALYWKAYAQNRAGRRQEALSTLAQLRHDYPSSRWNNDARALNIEVRAQEGSPVNPSVEANEELKLLAINSLMQSDPDMALPALQKVLTSNNSDKVKERALFVLVQNRSSQAQQTLSGIARGAQNPDLQLKAIRYMGMMGSNDSRQELASIYNSSTDDRIKRAILQGFMLSGSRNLLLNAAKTEKNPELRHEAIRQLSLSGGGNEIWQLYESNSSLEDKKAILKSMFLSGNSQRLAELARSEKDPSLRAAAIKSLGLMGNNGRADTLVSIYRSDNNHDVRKEILKALFLQQNGKALVDLARSEKDPEMKAEIVKQMSLVHSKEVTDYMMEVLK